MLAYLLVVSIEHLSFALVVITYHVADEDTAAVDNLCLPQGRKWSILSQIVRYSPSSGECGSRQSAFVVFLAGVSASSVP